MYKVSIGSKKSMLITILLGSMAAAIGLCLLLSGCSMNQLTENDTNNATPFTWHTGIKPTQKQIEIARALGCEEDVITRQEEYGMEKSFFENVIPAEACLMYMETRYSTSFSIKTGWLDKSNDSQNEYHLQVIPVGIENRPTHEVCVRWEENGNVSYSDSYLLSKSESSYSDYVAQLLDPAVKTCSHTVLVGATFKGEMLDGSIPVDATIEQIAENQGGLLYVFFTPDNTLTEEEYDKELSTILRAARDTNLDLYYHACSITLPDSENALTVQDCVELYKWSGYYNGDRKCQWERSETI